MKVIGKYFATGCAAAIMGMFFSDIFAGFFNGVDYGSALVFGMGMYLCVVVFTCTGIIVSRITAMPKEDTSEEKEEPDDRGEGQSHR